MKRTGYLFEKAFTPEALLAAYHAAARHKRGKRACFQFEKHLASNLSALHHEIHAGAYQPQPYYEFCVFEPKHRRIFAPAFRDLVVQHAIYAVIRPIFEAGFIDQSFACRVGFGTHKAADYAERSLQQISRDSYTIKLDIRKFFYRIDREILRQQIQKKIKDQRFVDLMMQFAEYGEPVGIPIGNLLSQIYALIYLNPLDHFVKRALRVRHYCRYVDDFVLFGLTHQECIDAKRAIEEFIQQALRLELSKYTIAPVRRGVNFVGYRTWASRRFIRKYSLYKFRRSVRQKKLASVVSILGHAKKTHSQKHMINYIKEQDNGLYRELPEVYQHNRYARA